MSSATATVGSVTDRIRQFLAEQTTDELVPALRATVAAGDPASSGLVYFIVDELYSRDAKLLAVVDRWAQALDDDRTQAQVVLDYFEV